MEKLSLADVAALCEETDNLLPIVNDIIRQIAKINLSFNIILKFVSKQFYFALANVSPTIDQQIAAEEILMYSNNSLKVNLETQKHLLRAAALNCHKLFFKFAIKANKTTYSAGIICLQFHGHKITHPHNNIFDLQEVYAMAINELYPRYEDVYESKIIPNNALSCFSKVAVVRNDARMLVWICDRLPIENPVSCQHQPVGATCCQHQPMDNNEITQPISIDFQLKQTVICNEVYCITRLCLRYGRIELLDYLHKKYGKYILEFADACDISNIARDYALLDSATWIYKHIPKYSWNTYLLKRLIKCGSISMSMIKKIFDKMDISDFISASFYAINSGNLEIVKFVFKRILPMDSHHLLCIWALDGNHLDILIWLRTRNPPFTWSQNTENAAKAKYPQINWDALESTSQNADLTDSLIANSLTD